MKWQRGLATWIGIKTFMGMCEEFSHGGIHDVNRTLYRSFNGGIG